MDTGTLLAGWCAFVVGLMAYRLLPVKRASPAGVAKRALQMQGYETGEEAPWWYNLLVLLEPLARRAPSRSLLKTEEDLYWAKLAGQFLRWDPVHLWCLRIGLALAALGFGMTFIGDLFLVGVLAALSFAAPGGGPAQQGAGSQEILPARAPGDRGTAAARGGKRCQHDAGPAGPERARK